jgi:hypothetical protein
MYFVCSTGEISSEISLEKPRTFGNNPSAVSIMFKNIFNKSATMRSALS